MILIVPFHETGLSPVGRCDLATVGYSWRGWLFLYG
jgi:hypothetical protein